MRVAILTSGLIVLALGALGYPLPRIGDVGSVEMTSVATLDQVPELVRRKYLVPPGPGSPGYGIGISAGSVDPIPPGSGGPPIQRITPINPVVPNPQPATPPPATPPPETPPPETPPPETPPPETPSPETPPSVDPKTKLSVDGIPIEPLIPQPNRPAVDQIRELDCELWFYGGKEFNAKPWYCTTGSASYEGGN
ncbi:hypothetical protein MMC22_009725 [Lobaria immixta]|nr:hypothetical protein [Lobaria immixta]